MTDVEMSSSSGVEVVESAGEKVSRVGLQFPWAGAGDSDVGVWMIL